MTTGMLLQTFILAVLNTGLLYLAVQAATRYQRQGELTGSKSGSSQTCTEMKDVQTKEERYQLIFAAGNEGLWEYDLITGQSYISDRIFEILGYDQDIDASVFSLDAITQLIHPDDLLNYLETEQALLAGSVPFLRVECRICCKDGQYRWIAAKTTALRDHHGIRRIAGSITDIHERKLQDQRVFQLAYYDALTGLPNRTMFFEVLQQIVKEREADGKAAAVLYIDTDDFRSVNETFGHYHGDVVLIDIAKNLSSIVDPKDCFVARIGGDTFAVVIRNVDQYEKPDLTAETILNQLSQPFHNDEIAMHLTATIGIAVFPDDGNTADVIVRNAETAMYQGKEEHGNRFVRYQASMNENVARRLLMSNRLRYAANRGELVLYYQPQIDVARRRIVGFEALLRWISPDYGMVQPAAFIPLAEETGLIREIGAWVLREACCFAGRVNQNRCDLISIAVNVSPVQLMSDDYVDQVVATLKEAGLPPELLGLEITETAMIHMFASGTEKLNRLKELGISTQLDDFGSGFSSLIHVWKLPISCLKIDKGFLAESANDARVIRLIQMIIDLSRDLGLNTVAEGVETHDQFDMLQRFGCDIVQGYLFSKPVPEAEAIRLIGSGQSDLSMFSAVWPDDALNH
ncbi:MAG: putative bifunctional diguanylate cyclase/phosphodiesterase [Solirubrobacterales bacterium]